MKTVRLLVQMANTRHVYPIGTPYTCSEDEAARLLASGQAADLSPADLVSASETAVVVPQESAMRHKKGRKGLGIRD